MVSVTTSTRAGVWIAPSRHAIGVGLLYAVTSAGHHLLRAAMASAGPTTRGLIAPAPASRVNTYGALIAMAGASPTTMQEARIVRVHVGHMTT